MSSDTALSSSARAPNPSDYYRQLLDARRDLASQNLKAEALAAKKDARQEDLALLQGEQRTLQEKITELQTGLKSAEIDKAARPIIERDVRVLSENTAALRTWHLQLSSEIRLKTNVTEIATLPITAVGLQRAEIFKTRGAQVLSLVRGHPQDLSADVLRHIISIRADLTRQAAETVPPLSTRVPRLPASPGAASDSALKISSKESAAVRTNPGKFLHEMVRTLEKGFLLKDRLELQKYVDLGFSLPTTVKQSIFNNMAQATLKTGKGPESGYNTDDFRSDLRLFVDAIKLTSVYRLHETPESKSTGALDSATVTPGASESSAPEMSLGDKLLTIIAHTIDARCHQLPSSRSRTLLLHQTFLMLDIPPHIKMEVYTELAKRVKSINPELPENMPKIVRYGRLNLGDNIEVLRKILNDIYTRENRSVPRSPAKTAPSGESWEAIELAAQMAMRGGSGPMSPRDVGGPFVSTSFGALGASSASLLPPEPLLRSVSRTPPSTPASSMSGPFTDLRSSHSSESAKKTPVSVSPMVSLTPQRTADTSAEATGQADSPSMPSEDVPVPVAINTLSSGHLHATSDVSGSGEKPPVIITPVTVTLAPVPPRTDDTHPAPKKDADGSSIEPVLGAGTAAESLSSSVGSLPASV